MKRLVVVFALTLSACAGVQTAGPQQSVFAAKQAYAVALTAAVTYKRLPLCQTGGSPLCSKKEVVVQLQKADDAAAALLDGAETVVRSGGGNAAMAVTAAEQAVAAFTTVTKMIGVK